MPHGPFLTLKQAAAYCGYAPETFRRKIKEYDFPRRGPEKNRYAQSDLDTFMVNPELYRHQPAKDRRGNRMISMAEQLRA